jgi:hypothetical protein
MHVPMAELSEVSAAAVMEKQEKAQEGMTV